MRQLAKILLLLTLGAFVESQLQLGVWEQTWCAAIALAICCPSPNTVSFEFKITACPLYAFAIQMPRRMAARRRGMPLMRSRVAKAARTVEDSRRSKGSGDSVLSIRLRFHSSATNTTP